MNNIMIFKWKKFLFEKSLTVSDLTKKIAMSEIWIRQQIRSRRITINCKKLLDNLYGIDNINTYLDHDKF